MHFGELKTWRACLLALSLYLSGCSFQHDISNDIKDYSDRLSRVLDVSLKAPSTAGQLHYPPDNALRQALLTFDITLPEFYAVQSCQLGSLVAERNTVLGKQQEQAATLVYEKALIAELESCFSALHDTNPVLADKLAEWKALKRAQSAKVWANLIQSSRETRLAFSQSSQLLTADSDNDDLGGLTALAYLLAVKDEPQPNISELNRQLKIFESSRVAAKIWRTQNVLAAQLSSLNNVLLSALPQVPCKDDLASEQAKILRNVFYLFFIEKIQPVGTRLNHFQYQLSPMLGQLRASGAIQPAFKQYIDERDKEFLAYQSAMHDHVQLWQHFLARCNLSPQKSG